MRKVIASMMLSVDGLFAGPNGEIDWHVWDEDMNESGRELLSSVDLILLGRVTYELMAGYWPSVADEDPIIKLRMNGLPKVVFSRTLTEARWTNSRVVGDGIVEEINRLKAEQGRDIVLLGSGSVLSQLTIENVIDEYRFTINPVVLGRGRALLGDFPERANLRLLGTRTYRCGNVMMFYEKG